MKSENFVLLAMAAEQFGCRPSQLVRLRDPVLALDFDLAATARLLDREQRSSEENGRDTEDTPPPRHRDIFW